MKKIAKARNNSRWWHEEHFQDAGELEGLPTRVVNVLMQAKLDTAQKVRDYGPDALLSLPTLGKTSLGQIKEWLRSLD